MGKPLKIILVGPAPPFRGGIADTQNLLGKSLIDQGHQIELWTFTKQYPKLLFPGKTQLTTDTTPSAVPIHQKIHGFAPWQWLKVRKDLRKAQADIIIFRYWTPFFALCWMTLSKGLKPSTRRIGLVDNWVPHENRFLSILFNGFFRKSMDAFMCLSPYVAKQIRKETTKDVDWKYHPLAEQTPPKKEKLQARKDLNWNTQKTIIAFVGLIRDYKGLDILLEALGKLPKDQLAQLELKVGGAFYSSVEPYKDLIEKLALKAHVELRDEFLSSDVLRDYICAADVVVLPYRRATQSGIIAQSIHYHCPLLVTDVGGLAEQLQGYPLGTIVPATVEGLGSGLKKLQPKSADGNITFQKFVNWEVFSKTILQLSSS